LERLLSLSKELKVNIDTNQDNTILNLTGDRDVEWVMGFLSDAFGSR